VREAICAIEAAPYARASTWSTCDSLHVRYVENTFYIESIFYIVNTFYTENTFYHACDSSSTLIACID
jgi:hypothetical protein